MIGGLSEFHVVRPVVGADGLQNYQFVTYKYGICSLR